MTTLTVAVSEDPARPIGQAILTLGGLPSTLETLEMALSRHGFAANHLGKGGWQSAECWLQPEEVWYSGTAIKVLLPEILAYQLENMPYTIIVRGEGLSDTVTARFMWPLELAVEAGTDRGERRRIGGTRVGAAPPPTPTVAPTITPTVPARDPIIVPTPVPTAAATIPPVPPIPPIPPMPSVVLPAPVEAPVPNDVPAPAIPTEVPTAASTPAPIAASTAAPPAPAAEPALKHASWWIVVGITVAVAAATGGWWLARRHADTTDSAAVHSTPRDSSAPRHSSESWNPPPTAPTPPPQAEHTPEPTPPPADRTHRRNAREDAAPAPTSPPATDRLKRRRDVQEELESDLDPTVRDLEQELRRKE